MHSTIGMSPSELTPKKIMSDSLTSFLAQAVIRKRTVFRFLLLACVVVLFSGQLLLVLLGKGEKLHFHQLNPQLSAAIANLPEGFSFQPPLTAKPPQKNAIIILLSGPDLTDQHPSILDKNCISALYHAYTFLQAPNTKLSPENNTEFIVMMTPGQPIHCRNALLNLGARIMNVPMVTAPGNITHRYGYAYTKFQMWALEGVFEKILYIDLDLMFIDKSPLDLFARIDAFHAAAELKNNSTKETLQQGKEEGTGGSSNSTSPSRQKFYGGVEDWNYWFIGCEQGIGCINSGLLVFEPDLVAYRALIELIPTTRSAIYDQHTLQVYYQSRSEHENFPPEYNTMWLPNGHNKEHMEKAIGFHFRYFDLDGHLYQRGGSYVPQKLVAQTLASKMPGRLMDLRRIQMENFQQGRGGVLPIVPVQFAELTDRITMTELRTQYDRVGVIAYGVGGTKEALDSRQAFSKHLYQAFLESQYQPKSLLTLFKVILEDLFEKYEWVWVVYPSLILKAEGKWPVHKQLDWLTKDLNDAAVVAFRDCDNQFSKSFFVNRLAKPALENILAGYRGKSRVNDEEVWGRFWLWNKQRSVLAAPETTLYSLNSTLDCSNYSLLRVTK